MILNYTVILLDQLMHLKVGEQLLLLMILFFFLKQL